jgi:CubicO group peptidase (beta-lactamase class C family)
MKRALAFLLLLATGISAQTIDTRAVDRLVAHTMAVWKIPGAAVAIVDEGTIYVKGYGFKEAGGSSPVTSDTLFGLASTSKAFTATAMAILVDEKKLSWDDPVRKHLGYFRLADPCADALVTLRDMVSHRTGLSRHDELWDNTPLTREQVIRAVGSLKLTHPIRSEYQYNNIMFMAAGDVVSAAANMPWNDFVRTRIFEPLGMTHTLTGASDFITSDHASGHRYDRRLDQPVSQLFVDDTNIGPAGAIKSSAHDLAQWIRFQLNDGAVEGKRLVSAEALGETKTPQMVIRMQGESRELNPQTNLQSYGMGWVIQDYRGEMLVSHAGALNGYRANVDLLPRQHAGFAVLINEGRGLAALSLRNALADLLLAHASPDWDGYYLALDRKSAEKEETVKRERNARRQTDTHPSHDLAAYAGQYANAAYGTATVTVEGKSLILRWNRLSLPLTHYHYDVFTAISEADDVDERIEFRSGAEGEVRTLTLFGEEFTKE